MAQAAKDLLEFGSLSVLLKGGHFTGDKSPDCLVLKNNRTYWFDAVRIDSDNTHGTGCTLSSAIAAYNARGYKLLEAVTKAKEYITGAIRTGANYKIGSGHGPVNHFFDLW